LQNSYLNFSTNVILWMNFIVKAAPRLIIILSAHKKTSLLFTFRLVFIVIKLIQQK
jgi:hypothetical protein